MTVASDLLRPGLNGLQKKRPKKKKEKFAEFWGFGNRKKIILDDFNLLFIKMYKRKSKRMIFAVISPIFSFDLDFSAIFAARLKPA